MTTARWYPTIATIADGSQIIIGGSTDAMDFNRFDGYQQSHIQYWPPKQAIRTLPILAWAFPNMLYPMVFVMPSERIFLFVSNKTVIIDPKTDEQIYTVPDMPVLDHAPSAVAQDEHCDASPMCWQISPDDPNPTWTAVDDMPRGRLLPTVLLCQTCLILKPCWEEMVIHGLASNYRLYHAGAAFTESGFIITMGSDMRFAPPYMQAAQANGRPIISKAPPSVTYKSSFIVEMVSSVNDVSRVTFIRQSSTTHQTNTDQRFIELKILGQQGSSLVVQAPDVPGRALQATGCYLLWIKQCSIRGKTVNLQIGEATIIPTGSFPLRKKSCQYNPYYQHYIIDVYCRVLIYDILRNSK
ncbi:hypothetical protein BSLG_005878 [Batrachochytrium salamandrivorans]|nr:hypothetical protein BSLG_005878 [Batrachochytrium salamandrivorans]